MRIIIEPWDAIPGCPEGEYVVSAPWVEAGIVRERCLIKGILTQDDLRFVVEGDLISYPKEVDLES